MAKQFVLEEVIREEQRNHRDERTVGSWTEVMQGARTQFSFLFQFANDQNRGISNALASVLVPESGIRI